VRTALVRYSLRNDPEERTSHILRGGSEITQDVGISAPFFAETIHKVKKLPSS
jgi:hypothetical protein